MYSAEAVLLKEIENKIKLISYGITNGRDYIKEYCLNLKTDVQLIAEQKIIEIHEFTTELVKKIDSYESQCIDSYVDIDIQLVNEFKQIINEFKVFQSKLIKQTNDSDQLLNKIKNEKNKLDQLIFSGYPLCFEPATKPFVLGSFYSIKKMSSNILSDLQFKELETICEFKSINWSLIYRASKDGFGANDFHSKCNDKENTLVIIKSTNGNVFGGYTEQNWNGYESKCDLNAFIFSFINNNTDNNKPIKIKSNLLDNQSIIGDPRYGPIFGHDIVICNNSNQIKSSYSDLGKSYKHPNYVYSTHEARSFLAGSYSYLTSEIEVYSKQV